MKRIVLGLLAAALLLPVGAAADVGSVLGDLVSGKSAAEAFTGTWTGPAGSDIDHIVVTAVGSGPVRIQVFGRCEARVCNWGALPARIRSDGPTSEAIRSLAADFNLGFALRHITLHRLPGNVLRFDMVTEFTDGSSRHDYETAGQLVPAGAQLAAAPPQAAPVPPAAAQTAAAPQQVPQAAAPVAGSGITVLNPLSWFESKPATPATQTGPVADDNSMPVAASTAPPVDDCFSIDTAHVYLVNNNGNWNVRDFLHVVQGFGPYRVAADQGQRVIAFYRFNEVCHIGRGATNMTFFRTAGEVPNQPMPGQDCIDIHPEQVAAVHRDDDWKVADASHEIFNYGSDHDGATQAATMIKALALSHQCYYDRSDLATSYWLAR